MLSFHRICGSRIKLSEDGRKAERLLAKTDFNNGVVFSEAKLGTNVIFQVRIDKKVGLWSGSIELGVTTICPESYSSESVPQSATELRNGTWLMASRTILQDGETLIENYGFDLEKLDEGDTVGLMRTNQGELVFFVNGTSQGVAAPYVPPDIYAIVNLYGKCAQISLVDVQASEQSTNTVELVVHEEVASSFSSSENNSDNDKLRFHANCGPLVKLSASNRTAERRRPMEEFNNAVVLTHRPLRDEELFQIRIDMLVHKWSGSIEFGLTTHCPDSFEFPATLTILRNGTVIMSGNGILHDGKATNSPYTHFNLDQLQEGDRIGVMRRGEDVHYFVNGVDQGVATTGVPSQVWGAINLYGMAAKVTIVDRNEREEHNLRINVRNHDYIATSVQAAESEDMLLFHPNCGFHAAVINTGRTAHRPNARDDFNHGVVLTNRTLKANEMFEVRLDKMVTKWAGSIEIGVTTHVPTQLDYPCTMTNVRSGTWMMTGNGIMHNGTSIVDEYGQSLDRLKVGDRVGVLRKENGNLHFFVNGEDQGCAATNVPEFVYGVIDLYGQAAQATIILHDSDNSTYNSDNGFMMTNNAEDNCGGPFVSNNIVCCSTDTMYTTDLRFHALHGRNARISNGGLTASRPNALGEFNAAIIISNRPLRDNELFEVIIERMVERWSGNIEAGVTSIRPEELVFPNTMTDIDHDTWMLSGSSIMTGGITVTNRYNCNLDVLSVGSRVGMMRKGGNLHFYVNGEDQGVASPDIPHSVYAVIDLYGQCAQVSITKVGDLSLISSQVVDSLSLPIAPDSSHRFSICCGKNIMLKGNNLSASRVRHFTHALVFSALPLDPDDTFEIRITESRNKWAGSLSIGLTTLSITDDFPATHIPPTLNALCPETWFVTGSTVRKNTVILRENYGVNLNRLSIGDRIGIRICSQSKSMKLFINGEDMGMAASGINKRVHVVVDLYGSTESISIVSTVRTVLSPNDALAESNHSLVEDLNVVKELSSSQSTAAFDDKHGRHVELSSDNMTAKRTKGYDHGITLSADILQRGHLFQVAIVKMNEHWTSSLMIGVVDASVDRNSLPASAIQFSKTHWVILENFVFHDGAMIKGNYGPNLDTLMEGNVVGLLLDFQSNLHLLINGVDQGVAANITRKCRAFVDIYGQCEQIAFQIGDSVKDLTKEVDSKVDHVKPIPKSLGNKCEYLNACVRLKTNLCLPERYFSVTESVMCYCQNCHFHRGDSLWSTHGDPEASYALPVGWVKFPLNIPSDSNAVSMTNSTSSLSNVLTTWHIAYYGLKIPHVRRVLDYGQLYNDIGSGWTRPQLPPKNRGKDEKIDIPPLIFSPVIKYASSPLFSVPKEGYVDFKTKKRVSVRVAFQLLVQPGSYKKGRMREWVELPEDITCNLDVDGVEWSTKEQGSTHISALLVSLDDF